MTIQRHLNQHRARFKSFILCLCLSIFLSGCLNTAMTGASAIYDRYNLQNNLTNHQIAMEIEDNIQKNPLYIKHRSNIHADCFDYQVLLTGETRSKSLRLKAANIAANTHDVKHVYNFIKIASPEKTETMHDMWLTSQIKGAIIARAKMNPDEIKVVTEQGTVYLMARLTHKQAKDVINVARYTPGVKHVVTIFEYITYSIH